MQGGPTCFFPRAKKNFPVELMDQETPTDTFFLNDSQFSLYLKMFIQKGQVTK